MDNKNWIIDELYHSGIVAGCAIGYSILGRNLLKIQPPTVARFDLSDSIKLAVIITMAEMTREMLIKQGLIPPKI